MFGRDWAQLSSLILLLASSLGPAAGLGDVRPSSAPLDKRGDWKSGDECWTKFASDPQNCPILAVAYFTDDKCSQPYKLTRTIPNAFIRDNQQMLLDGAVAHSLQSRFGSIRIVAAVPGIGLGFAKGEESDTVVQNMAWMSPEKVSKAFKEKSCVTFPNLDASQVGVWTVRADNTLNQDGFVWNPDNLPIKHEASACRKSKRSLIMKAPIAEDSCPVCLEGASWGYGGVLELYTSDDCTADPKNPHSMAKQLYSTVQCTVIDNTAFRSFKAVQPVGGNIDPIFSPIFYDLDGDGYHRCSQKGISQMRFKTGECQKMQKQNLFVGVYGNDPGNGYHQPAPSPGEKVLREASGGLLLSPVAAHHPAPVHDASPGHAA